MRISHRDLLALVPDIAEPSEHTAFDMMFEPEFPPVQGELELPCRSCGAETGEPCRDGSGS